MLHPENYDYEYPTKYEVYIKRLILAPESQSIPALPLSSHYFPV